MRGRWRNGTRARRNYRSRGANAAAGDGVGSSPGHGAGNGGSGFRSGRKGKAVLDDREVFELMETAVAAGVVLDRMDASLFDFMAEAAAAGIVPHRPMPELTGAEAERLREWMRGCAMIARHADDPEWLSGQVIARMCEVRRAIARQDFGEAMLRARQAEFANGVLAKLLARADERAGLDADVALNQIERWR